MGFVRASTDEVSTGICSAEASVTMISGVWAGDGFALPKKLVAWFERLLKSRPSTLPNPAVLKMPALSTSRALSVGERARFPNSPVFSETVELLTGADCEDVRSKWAGFHHAWSSASGTGAGLMGDVEAKDWKEAELPRRGVSSWTET